MRFAKLFLVPCLGLAACPADDEGGESTLVTYNVGLAFGYVDEATARIQPLIDAVSAVDADVVCLQELWVNQDEQALWTSQVIDQFLEGTSANFPHNYWSRTTVPADAPPTGCTTDESDPLEACVRANCIDEPIENLATCTLTMCMDEFGAVSSRCMTCLASNLGGTFDAILAACRGLRPGGIAYDGHNGLAILSRHPLEATETQELTYALTARSILKARADLPGMGATDLYCTHIAADLADQIDYPTDSVYTSYAEENAAQTQAVLDWAATSDADSVALLGDFNHGPEKGMFTSELPDNHRLVIDAGYSSSLVDDPNAGCTVCGTNQLSPDNEATGKLIDHVYLKLGRGAVTSTDVIFDETQDILTASGETKALHISDHFGVSVVVTN